MTYLFLIRWRKNTMIRTLIVEIKDLEDVGSLTVTSSESLSQSVTIKIEGDKMAVKREDLKKALDEVSRFHESFVKQQALEEDPPKVMIPSYPEFEARALYDSLT